MDKCINMQAFLRPLIDEEKLVRQGSEIMVGLLAAQSPRMTNISEKMSGQSERNYRVIQGYRIEAVSQAAAAAFASFIFGNVRSCA